MATRMQQRRGTAEQWTSSNPVLSSGEIGFESDTGFFKIGDGINQWGDLSYFATADGLEASLSDYIELSEKGSPNGVAELDANGQVPASQLANATVDLSDYATTNYVDTAVSGLVDSAPGLLDTLNELAAAIGDDANFVTTINTSITDGDAATLSAAEDYTDNALANFTTLPDQTGNAGEYLTTDGTNASWAPLTLDKALDDLTDVAVGNPSDGHALVYSAIASRWESRSVETDLSEYATESYVDAAVAGIVDSAPGTLNTLNELAAALGDDANFATTVTNSIAAKPDSLADLDDVNAPSPSGGDVLEWDGTAWVSGQQGLSNLGSYISNGIIEVNSAPLQIGIDESYVATLTYVDTALLNKSDTNHTHAISDVTNLQTSLDQKSDKLVSFVAVAGSKTLALTDADKMLEISAAATITIPTNASVAFPVGTTINLTQTGTGTVSVVAASGATVNFTPSNTLRAQWSSAVLVKRATNTWLLSGDLL
jgi:hypothetical protein